MREKTKNKTQEGLISEFRTIYDDVPFIVSYKKPNLEIIYCNKLMAQYTGHQQTNEVLGKTDFDFRWAEFAHLYTQHERDALNNKIYPALYPICNYEGKEGLVIIHRIPLFDNLAQPKGVLSHAYFVTSKQGLELSNLLLEGEPVRNCRGYSIGKNQDISLTRRERECLFYLVRGKSNKGIANALNLSDRTIEAYVEQLKFKFNCAYKGELIDKAVEMGYLYDLPSSLLRSRS